MIKLLFLFKIRLDRFLIKLKMRIYYKNLFKYFGNNSLLFKPILIIRPENIIIGDNVQILKNAWISANPINDIENCILEVGNGCSIGNFCHIYSTKKIIIEEKVLIADKVYISDNLHSYSNIRIPIIDQKIKQINSVRIGAGSWIGENVSILGSKIGKHCVVGANSVVTKDIPDYSIAVGCPAKVIKRYNFDKKKWIRSSL